MAGKRRRKSTEDPKRTHARYGIASLAEVTFPESGEAVDALVSNVSQGGIGIYSPVPLTVGRDVRVKISFLQTNGNQEVTEVIPGKVAWVKPLHNHFVIGITFTVLDSDRHSNLLNTIQGASRKEG